MSFLEERQRLIIFIPDPRREPRRELIHQRKNETVRSIQVEKKEEEKKEKKCDKIIAHGR
jgi:hypothetical protein